jgi:hypothetical protein
MIPFTAALRRTRALLLLAGAATATGACDPCFGSVGCGAERMSLRVEVLGGAERTPVEGVRVQVARTGGAHLGRDTLTGTTGPDGSLVLETSMDGPSATADVVVTPPAPYLPDTLRDVRLSATGSGNTLGLALAAPRVYTASLLNLYLRANNAPLGAAAVEFRRTGGPAIVENPYTATSNEGGQVWITPVVVERGQAVVGDLVARTPAGVTWRHTGLDLPLVASPQDYRVQRVGVGPSLSYWGRILAVGDSTPLEGATVSFHQTGGIAATPVDFTVVTNLYGSFAFQMHALSVAQEGEVVGDLTIVPPAPYARTTVVGVRLPTFDTDEFRHAGDWPVPRAP